MNSDRDSSLHNYLAKLSLLCRSTMSENDNEEDPEICIPELENGMISLFEWISRGKMNLEQEQKAFQSFESHQMLVKEIEQKYMKFLSSEDKSYINKVVQTQKKYEKAQTEIQAIITELVTSSERLNTLKSKINNLGSNRDTNSRLRVKILERRDRRLRSALVKADMSNSHKLIKDLQAEFPRIEEIANSLEKRFHHNLGRFLKPGYNEKDASEAGQTKTSSKGPTDRKLEIKIEIKGQLTLCEMTSTSDDTLHLTVPDNIQLTEPGSLLKLTEPEIAESKSEVTKQLLMKTIQKGKKKKKFGKQAKSKTSQNYNDKNHEISEVVEIPTVCSLSSSSFNDGPNDKGIQTDPFDCSDDFSDREDLLLVEISGDEFEY